MKKILTFAICICLTLLCSVYATGIPQGKWLKKNYITECYGDDQTLELSFDKPLNFKGKTYFGSLWLPSGSCFTDFYMFGNKEITGSTIKCKAYKCTDEGGDRWFDNEVKDCIITYDEKSGNIKINIKDVYDYAFGPSDRCTRVMSDADNLNIRKSPVNGAKIGTMTKFQTLPMLSVVHTKNGDDWYEVQLPEGTGFVSGKYVSNVSPSWLTIPACFLKGDISYGHMYDDPKPEFVRQTTLDFKRKGNQVMCHSFTGFPLVFRLPYDEYKLGHIEENKIIFDRWINGYNSDIDPDALFEAGNFSELAKHTEECSEEVYYFNSEYANGLIYDMEGAEFSPLNY